MLAAANTIAPPAMAAPPVEYAYDPLEAGLAGQRQFRKHKVLPRPREEAGNGSPPSTRTASSKYDAALDASRPDNSTSQQASPKTLKHQSKRIGSGPDLPPTPPRQPRRPSIDHPARPSSPASSDAVPQTPKNHPTKSPATPPNQQSPPTPDVTPPQPVGRPRAIRPSLADRGYSRTTTGDSRSESFTTAREDLSSSEDDGKSAGRLALGSATTSQATMRRVPEDDHARTPQPNALGIALDGLERKSSNGDNVQNLSNLSPPDSVHTPSVRRELDLESASQRSTATAKRTAPASDSYSHDIQEPEVEGASVKSSKGTDDTRQSSSNEPSESLPTPRRRRTRTAETSSQNIDNSISMDVRRASAVSTRSTASTIVEAFLVDTPSQPQRQRTLRHVRKQSVLRDASEPSPSSTSQTLSYDRNSRERPLKARSDNEKHESFASNTTANSISSSKARREVWKNGGIPVVIVPDRRSSSKTKSNKEPSLRSNSSRRSKRSASVSSVPNDVTAGSTEENPATKEEDVVLQADTAIKIDDTKSKDDVVKSRDDDRASRGTGSISRESGPIFPRPGRQARTYSDSDSLDLRTIDYPPNVPRRSSSLSAPTSRNASRANSLTTESIKAHNAFQDSLTKRSDEAVGGVRKAQADRAALSIGVARTSMDSDREGIHRRAYPDRHDDYIFAKGYSALNTPFSAASVETNGTNPEVSEAQAIHMYPHQNSSVLMVDHSTKLSDSSDGLQKDEEVEAYQAERPKIVMSNASGKGPATPPQPSYTLDDIDSPLRNPRAPPEPPQYASDHPPAINFIPATPSGTTPAHEKVVQMGNYFETIHGKPPRRPSLVRRALSRRRHSVEYPPSSTRSPGFLSRTLSLSRNSRKNAESSDGPGYFDVERTTTYPNEDDTPAEEDKLHPFWRPQYSSDDEYDGRESDDADEREEEVYRYPPVDNRPAKNNRSNTKRSLSSRVKRTFAILPTWEDEPFFADDRQGTERRTIRRTSSGNLRVMRHRASFDSLRRSYQQSERPYTLAVSEVGRELWRSGSTRSRRASKERRRFSLSHRLGQIQNLPRRLSEKRREKRTNELRQKISGPREVRDGVGEVIRSGSDRFQNGTTGRV